MREALLEAVRMASSAVLRAIDVLLASCTLQVCAVRQASQLFSPPVTRLLDFETTRAGQHRDSFACSLPLVACRFRPKGV